MWKCLNLLLLVGGLLLTTSYVHGQNGGKKNLGILLFDGVEVIDYTGPYEALSYASKDGENYFTIFTVAKNVKPVQSGPLSIIPNYTFDNHPPMDYLLVPGGVLREPFHNDTTLQWIRQVSAKAIRTMSVCNGAYLLAKSGVLDNKMATTTASGAYSGNLSEYGNNIKVVYDRRYVWSGNVLTTSGLSSGIDGALGLIEKELGLGAAQDAALSMEYNWNRNAGFVRAKLADMCFINTYRELRNRYKANVIQTEGTEKRWTCTLRMNRIAEDSLSDKLREIFEKDGWKVRQMDACHLRMSQTNNKQKACKAKIKWVFRAEAVELSISVTKE
jgi:putative intracellular protease/amidase